MPQVLSRLWIFITLNYIFCDVFSLYLSSNLQELLKGGIGELRFTEAFLLKFAIVMEIPMLMVLLSRFLKRKPNRIINIFVAILMLIVQVGSIVTGKNSLHYIFFSIIEISTLFAIILIAYKWQTSQPKFIE
tara:strand:+ start:2128 stop:2523 length:396 start_codon:yes stop_codon:yes gene_type:complete